LEASFLIVMKHESKTQQTLRNPAQLEPNGRKASGETAERACKPITPKTRVLTHFGSRKGRRSLETTKLKLGAERP
ncbi:hypothetical protein, partial [Rhodopirellula sallentina]|uniref:hypothetical protein n=1 Tax=Rhodopirellula sallentina TaxID=1263869 RepID=UPI0005C7A67D